jgi:hypothetical protein
LEACARSQLLRFHTGCSVELERGEIVVGKHLRVILGTPEQLDPLGRPLVFLRPRRPRDLRVRDVPDEQVAEDVLVLVSDGRPPFAADELLPLEPVQELLGLASLAVSDSLERPEPEDLADDGRVLKQQLLLDRERIEAGGDDPLHGLRQPEPASALAQLIDHACELLGVEWVASRALDQRRLQVGRQHGPFEQGVDQVCRVVVRQRRERDRGRVRLPSAPPRAA